MNEAYKLDIKNMKNLTQVDDKNNVGDKNSVDDKDILVKRVLKLNDKVVCTMR